jgi:hypothetical protein
MGKGNTVIGFLTAILALSAIGVLLLLQQPDAARATAQVVDPAPPAAIAGFASDPDTKSGSLQLTCGSSVSIDPVGSFRCVKVTLAATDLCPVKLKIACVAIDTLIINPVRNDSLEVSPPARPHQSRSRTLCCNAANFETLSAVEFTCLSRTSASDCAFSYEMSR